jgi:hypothetical protein
MHASHKFLLKFFRRNKYILLRHERKKNNFYTHHEVMTLNDDAIGRQQVSIFHLPDAQLYISFFKK